MVLLRSQPETVDSDANKCQDLDGDVSAERNLIQGRGKCFFEGWAFREDEIEDHLQDDQERGAPEPMDKEILEKKII